MSPPTFRNWLNKPDRHPLVMGVLNVTPDSFSDGGRYHAADAAVAAGMAMLEAGADLIDVGGESTRPGSDPVSADEQARRVLEPVRRLAAAGATLSIDTTRSAVAQAALDAGAMFVNDVSAGRDDPEMLPLVAEAGCPVVLMHMRGTPRTMQQDLHYDDVTAEVKAFLADAVARAERAGIPPADVLLDVGIGFGKSIEQNLKLLKDLPAFRSLGRPLLVGTSRKGFIGQLTGEPVAANRLAGTAATVAMALAGGADVVRVHDVAFMKQVRDMTLAVLRA